MEILVNDSIIHIENKDDVLMRRSSQLIIHTKAIDDIVKVAKDINPVFQIVCKDAKLIDY